MIDKIQVTIDVIIHATEDISKIYQSFKELLDLKEENFTIHETVGHFDNPIIILNAKMVKKEAQNFMKKLLGLLSIEQINQLIEEIEERTVDSRFHMRLDKQELIKGNLVLKEKDTIKIKIYAPIYNKKNTVKIFTEIFQIAN
ncbi:exosome protein [Marine Group I thaumarchaeote]|uniref:Exosome protein n=1 Tax=Marine Group I thaumarchaeote TaxID=2511932 RepID=A0A7K4P4B2_9ARCH|nr:exosome protein [Candidatus Nitrosopumilus sp. MTA1]NWJ20458.1 exosome protein [Marine Group I thaumarchaeote]NWK00890.1 exosome protein [Marine Group I thaumarchaeote]NWK13582.1 exosome protein [Marine Group I thaumarchaeote]